MVKLLSLLGVWLATMTMMGVAEAEGYSLSSEVAFVFPGFR